MLKSGDRMPDVTLAGPEGAPVRLRELLGESALVVYFYPRDFTPGCTAQACGFRDDHDDFVEAGARVVGVSSDDAASHAAFVEKHRLPFLLLSDPGGAAREAFGVGSTLGILPGRATFVIDRGGIVRCAYASQLRTGEHVRRALSVVRGLGA